MIYEHPPTNLSPTKTTTNYTTYTHNNTIQCMQKQLELYDMDNINRAKSKLGWRGANSLSRRKERIGKHRERLLD